MRLIRNSRFGGLYIFATIFLILAFVSRLVLTIKSASTIDIGVFDIFKIYSVGLFFDVVACTYFVIPYVLFLMLLPDKVFNHLGFKYFSIVIHTIALFILFLNVASEYFFWDEFGVRYNFIAIDYLIYTTEVIENIQQSYPMPLIIGTISILVGATLFFLFRKNIIQQTFQQKSSFGNRLKVGGVFLLLPAIFYLTVSLSFANISPNKYNQELSKNGIYSIFAAFRNNELDYNHFYISQEVKNVDNNLRNHLSLANTTFTQKELLNIEREIVADSTEKRYNLMFITVESLSCSYMKTFGSKRDITPYLDLIAAKSLLFTNFHATGNRTVRGLEALTLSIPPTPGRSIVKRQDNGNMFSAGQLFRDKGYDTKFIYAGYGYFDNMNTFMQGNGFSIVDRTEFQEDEQTFTTAWGVCDEDLFRRTLREADKSYKAGKAFFNFILTTSNHRPFTYPEGRIDVPSGEGRHGGVKYTDYAVNQFIKEAELKPWFKNTIFVIVADHCGGSAGRSEVPVLEYEIPLMIYNPHLVKAQKVDKLSSQIDVMPTILGLMNWSYTSKFFGKDIMKMKPKDERALIATYQKLGFMRGDKLVVLGPQQKANFYKYTRGTENLIPIEPDKAMLDEAIAYYQGAYYIFTNKLNKIKNQK